MVNYNYKSRFSKLYELSLNERRVLLEERLGLDSSFFQAFEPSQALSLEQADGMVENAIGVFSLPVGLAVNFLVDDLPVVVPMVTEEPSIVAGASNMARLVGLSGGFTTEATPPVMKGQIQVLNVRDIDILKERICQQKEALLGLLNGMCPNMVARGGGCLDIQVRALPSLGDKSDSLMASVDVSVDCRDAMGANLVNTLMEHLAQHLVAAEGWTIGARILSNLSDERLATATCSIPYAALACDAQRDNGREVGQSIVAVYEFARRDVYRACTHNKGIFNAIDAVAIATGNDWRALEAGGHAYAARHGMYAPLSHFELDDEKSVLRGSLTLPLAVGVVGGSTRFHAGVKANLYLLGPFGKSSTLLARLMVAVGLAENLGSLRALAIEGIQKGHMALHERKAFYGK